MTHSSEMPRAFETHLGTRRLLFRPLRSDDKERIRAGLAQLSPESRYRRFFRHIDHLSDKDLAYLTEIDGENHVAWIAVFPDEPGEPGVGIARWIRIAVEPDVAEAAVTVIDAYQNNGIGKTLLWLIARSARQKGIRAFRAWVQGENRVVLNVLQGFGAGPGRWESGVLEVDVPLPEDLADMHTSAAPLVLQAVASGRLSAGGRPDGGGGAELRPGGG